MKSDKKKNGDVIKTELYKDENKLYMEAMLTQINDRMWKNIHAKFSQYQYFIVYKESYNWIWCLLIYLRIT